MADRPMNPYAERDFSNAIKDAEDYFGEKLKEMDEKFPFLKFDDLKPEYCGTMRLDYLNGLGGWQDVMNILIAHGYEVTTRLEDATETEKELDGVEKWIVIEYGEVE